MKLVLQLASDYTSAFDTIIASYSQIANVLPRFDRLNAAFKDNYDVQQVLAILFADISAFHECAYQFVRRPGK